jgi:hypothetical protein
VWAVIDDQTIVVPLGGVLPDGATATIVVPFSATLRSGVTGSSWLFTRRNGIVAMHRWIPWISLRRPFDRPNHGDPFVTPVSPPVTVRIRSDVPLGYGNTGDRISTSADRLTRTFRATNVRDFVVTAAADFRSKQVVVGDMVWVVHPAAPATLDAAVNALRRLEEISVPGAAVISLPAGTGWKAGIVWIPTGLHGNLRHSSPTGCPQ